MQMNQPWWKLITKLCVFYEISGRYQGIPFHSDSLRLIGTYVINYNHCFVLNISTYSIIEVNARMSDYSPLFYVDVNTYPCPNPDIGWASFRYYNSVGGTLALALCHPLNHWCVNPYVCNCLKHTPFCINGYVYASLYVTLIQDFTRTEDNCMELFQRTGCSR